MPKVLISQANLAHVDGAHVRVLRDAGFEIVYPARAVQLTEEDLLRELPEVSAVLAGSEPYTRRVLEAAPLLRVIARAGVGCDAVDVSAATERSVVVTFTPGANREAVAEHVFALMLNLARKVGAQHRALQAGQWPRRPVLSLRGRTLGIVGLGHAGKAVAVRAGVFGLHLLAHEPFPDEDFVAQHRITLLPLEQVFSQSDFVTLHLPLLPETKHLVNRRTLAWLKPSAFLINTARGGLVCEADLVEALQAGRLAGAALDVFEQEPPGENPLFRLDNILATAHTAGIDFQALDDMALRAAESIAALRRGDWPEAEIVNPQVREKIRVMSNE